MARNPKNDAGQGAAAPIDPEAAVVVVTSTRPQRWRAGRKFGPTAVRIPASDLTEAEFDAISSDPVLKVHMEPAEAAPGE